MNESNLNNNSFDNNNANNIPVVPAQPMNDIPVQAVQPMNGIPPISSGVMNTVPCMPAETINTAPAPTVTTNTVAVSPVPEISDNAILQQPSIGTNPVTPQVVNPMNTVNNQPIPMQNGLGQSGQDLNMVSQPTVNLQANNNINPVPVTNNIQQNPLPNNQMTSQAVVNPEQAQYNSNMGNPMPNQQIPNQQNSNNNSEADEELLRAFIGKNYNKVTTKHFNLAGFFFSPVYMLYRKMFAYGLLVYLIEFILINFVDDYTMVLAYNAVISVLVALFVNKLYVSYAKKQVEKIKAENTGKDLNGLKDICATKGGTSVGKVILGMIIAGVVAFLLYSFGNVINNDKGKDKDNSTTGEKTLVENVSVGGYSCINSKCSVTMYDSNNDSTDYALKISNSDLFNALGDYKDYIKLNIYYTGKGDDKTIVDYKIYAKSNDEDVSSAKTESELREKLGLYSLGVHTETLTLTKKDDAPGVGFSDGKSYTYIDCTFTDSKGNEYEMEYINPESTITLVEGNEYTVTFEVSEGIFDYEYKITLIK